MFEMQVRCVWVILNNQVRVNFSTNCKCRHIQYICRFLTIRFPLLDCPKVQEMAFQRLQISKFHGEHAPGPPRNLTPSALDFRAFGARKLVTKIPTSTPGSSIVHPSKTTTCEIFGFVKRCSFYRDMEYNYTVVFVNFSHI